MGKVVNIRRPLIEAVARNLMPEIEALGEVGRSADELDGLDASEWRRAAVLAGHRCGWRIATAVSPDGAYLRAVAVNRPTDLDQERIVAEALTRGLLGRGAATRQAREDRL